MKRIAHLFMTTIAFTLTGCASTGWHVTPPNFLKAQHMYQTGHTQQALHALSLLATDGDANAQYALGYIYYQGQQVPRNITLARGYFEAAAKQGNTKAIQALSRIKLRSREAL